MFASRAIALVKPMLSFAAVTVGFVLIAGVLSGGGYRSDGIRIKSDDPNSVLVSTIIVEHASDSTDPALDAFESVVESAAKLGAHELDAARRYAFDAAEAGSAIVWSSSMLSQVGQTASLVIDGPRSATWEAQPVVLDDDNVRWVSSSAKIDLEERGAARDRAVVSGAVTLTSTYTLGDAAAVVTSAVLPDTDAGVRRFTMIVSAEHVTKPRR
ncbi:MAG: hypothetical protein AAGI53_01335 [Planctomycetota bacterium]